LVLKNEFIYQRRRQVNNGRRSGGVTARKRGRDTVGKALGRITRELRAKRTVPFFGNLNRTVPVSHKTISFSDVFSI